MSAQTAVQEVFLAAVQAFNNHNVPGVMQYIDPEAPTIYSVTGQVAFSGYEGVQQYLVNEFASGHNPNFDPSGIPIPTFNSLNTTALVTGTATWTSENTEAEGYQLLYAFTFVKRGNSPWLILTMWGS